MKTSKRGICDKCGANYVVMGNENKCDLAERFHSEKAGSESWQALNTLTGYIARREYETQGKGNSPPKMKGKGV
jgi:hypothetical protein